MQTEFEETAQPLGLIWYSNELKRWEFCLPLWDPVELEPGQRSYRWRSSPLNFLAMQVCRSTRRFAARTKLEESDELINNLSGGGKGVVDGSLQMDDVEGHTIPIQSYMWGHHSRRPRYLTNFTPRRHVALREREKGGTMKASINYN